MAFHHCQKAMNRLFLLRGTHVGSEVRLAVELRWRDAFRHGSKTNAFVPLAFGYITVAQRSSLGEGCLRNTRKSCYSTRKSIKELFLLILRLHHQLIRRFSCYHAATRSSGHSAVSLCGGRVGPPAMPTRVDPAKMPSE